MNEEMKFPKTFEEFIKQYSFFDKQQIYTNGSELIQVFRIKQWEEHKEKENQELKEKYLNAVADYETTMFEKEQLNSLVNSCQEEIRRLKKQLKEYKRLGFKHLNDKCNKLENQQKEFIKYLEDEIEKATTNPYTKLSEYGMNRIHIYKEILQKYKSIIGVLDEKK